MRLNESIVSDDQSVRFVFKFNFLKRAQEFENLYYNIRILFFELTVCFTFGMHVENTFTFYTR